jgi:hypothetical protein
MNRGGKTLALGAWLVLTACGGTDAEPAIGPTEVTSVRDHVVYIDHGRDKAVLLDVSGASAPSNADVVPLIPGAMHFEPRLAHDDQLLILCAGRPDDGKQEPASPGLVVLGADGKVRNVDDYESAFDRMAQSEDGKYVVLSFSATANAGASTLLFNPNEIAIVDLEAESKTVVRTLRSFGGSLQDVAFSPPVTIGDTEPRRLAVALFQSVVSVVDLSHPERREYTVELSRSGSANIVLSQVLFSPTEPKIYLRAQNSNDVYVVSLSPAEPGPDRDNDFVPVLNQLGAGVGPSDLALFDESGETRLLVTSPGSSEAVVIEPNGSNVTSVHLPRAANRILRFEGPSPFDTQTASRALLYGADQSSVTFLDLDDIEERASRNVDLLTVAEPFSDAVLIDPQTVMLVHASSGLSLLDLGGRTVAELSGPNLKGAVTDPNVKKLWLPPKGEMRLGYLDLDQGFHPNEVRVDAPIDTLVTVPSQDHPKVVVTHVNSTGYITVLDANDPTNTKAAYSMRGFLLTGAL